MHHFNPLYTYKPYNGKKTAVLCMEWKIHIRSQLQFLRMLIRSGKLSTSFKAKSKDKFSLIQGQKTIFILSWPKPSVIWWNQDCSGLTLNLPNNRSLYIFGTLPYAGTLSGLYLSSPDRILRFSSCQRRDFSFLTFFRTPRFSMARLER